MSTTTPLPLLALFVQTPLGCADWKVMGEAVPAACRGMFVSLAHGPALARVGGQV